MSRPDYWAQFWADKSDPLHSASDDAYYARLATELKLILPEQFTSVLDVGCGNGALYQRLGFDKAEYSGAMIDAFRAQFPEANVAVKDLRSIGSEGSYDLVFSHGVVQFIPLRDFADQISATVALLRPGGYIVHAGILWDAARWSVYSGGFLTEPGNALSNVIRYVAVRTGLRPSMGHWYSLSAIRSIAKRHGLNCSFTGSVLNPYRFHAILQKPA
jgi:SAM-dependent methyltransferase